MTRIEKTVCQADDDMRIVALATSSGVVTGAIRAISCDPFVVYLITRDRPDVALRVVRVLGADIARVDVLGDARALLDAADRLDPAALVWGPTVAAGLQ